MFENFNITISGIRMILKSETRKENKRMRKKRRNDRSKMEIKGTGF